ncbi:Pyruvate decarboxylase 1 [Citrus sinensis]|uniref:Pyruvate decarboxylase 1 n=1 Tax=Citrus sinensis TaxID=2711 RepID=A0ACB8IXG2_CITSI|nr:Pyruvate decarboxylase 1 [Citrus sinensis]
MQRRPPSSSPADSSSLLDHLIAEPGSRDVGCCNELNAGYAADGSARARAVGAYVVTFTVGRLSIINAIAGAYSENLPAVICISNFDCTQRKQACVYISISCNLAAVPHSTFSREPIPFALSPRLSNKMGLEAAVEATITALLKAVKPAMIGGPKLSVSKATIAFVELADACGYAFAVMPSAKGMIVQFADAYIFAESIFNDYSSVGYSLLLNKTAILVQPDRIVDFLSTLAMEPNRNTSAYESYHRIYVPHGIPLKSNAHEPLMLSGNTAVIAETGDSWYEFEMQYRSIGWSVGATLQKNIIFLINNGNYTIQVEIHDGPYNVIENWNYTGLVETRKIVHKDDTGKELLKWGSRVSAANNRPPNPQ